jgi:iron complex outermembrane receptor protein
MLFDSARTSAVAVGPVPPAASTPSESTRQRGRAGLRLLLCVAAGLAGTGFAAPAHAIEVAVLDIKQLTIEELMEIDVYSASRRLEPVQGVPAAIFVLTGEDIRRARVTSVPEALRLVPGVNVGRVDANKWAVSVRGFNTREANKLLVLVDGRSIYDAFFSGVFWESQDLMLEDIDRIEVIRGPGGTLWGANAVNGVINIITRHARDTQGGLLAAAAGTEERYTAAARYGWQPQASQHARVYAKAFGRDTGFSQPEEPHDQWRMKRGGFRWDWHGGGRDELRVSGDVFSADAGIRHNPALVEDHTHRGSNLIARWQRQVSATENMHVQFYYDEVSLDSISFDQRRDSADIEFQHGFRPWPGHQLVWGAGYRRMRDFAQTGLQGFVDILPARRDDALTHAFVQDTIALVPERWQLTLGTKLEDTDYADPEWQPGVRLAWTPSAHELWWASASRAVRVPSRVESDLTFLGTIRIGDRMTPEELWAYELGYRSLQSQRFWYDVAAFYNVYDDLRTSEQNGTLRNFMNGRTYGGELALRWQASPSLRLDAAYTWLKMELTLDGQSTSNSGQLAFLEGLSPRQQLMLRAALDVSERVEFDATVRYVSELPTLDVPAYTELDLGLSYHPRDDLELSLVGQNLLDSQHPEQDFALSSSGMPTEVQRSVYAKARWQF